MEAVAGQRTAINLGGVEVGDVSRGETLMTPGTLSVTRRIDAEIDLLRVGEAAQARRARAPAQRHRRSAGPRVDRRDVVRDCGRRTATLVRVRLEAPAVLTRGDRFIIRAYSPPITIGGGIVLDPGADAARRPNRGRPRESRSAADRPRRRRRRGRAR